MTVTIVMAELFFSIFKREVVECEHFATRAQARAHTFAWLCWYDAIRLHSSLDYSPPVDHEEQLAEQSLVACQCCRLREGSCQTGQDKPSGPTRSGQGSYLGAAHALSAARVRRSDRPHPRRTLFTWRP